MVLDYIIDDLFQDDWNGVEVADSKGSVSFSKKVVSFGDD